MGLNTVATIHMRSFSNHFNAFCIAIISHIILLRSYLISRSIFSPPNHSSRPRWKGRHIDRYVLWSSSRNCTGRFLYAVAVAPRRFRYSYGLETAFVSRSMICSFLNHLIFAGVIQPNDIFDYITHDSSSICLSWIAFSKGDT